MSKINEIVVVDSKKGFVGYETVEISKHVAIEGEKALSHSFLMDSFRKIMGRTLTLIDSSVTDKQQNKAMKDIVRNIFSDEMEFAAEFAYDQEKFRKMADNHYKDVSDEEIEASAVTIEEALGVEV